MAKRYSPRLGFDIRIKPEKPAATAVKVRPCAHGECGEEGTYRVPKSREQLSSYIWLCLSHAREHNEKWDFFSGMSGEEIERFRNEALIGHRPTWPLGKRAARVRNNEDPARFDDRHGVFADAADAQPPRPPERPRTRLQLQALETLHLEPSATLNQIKARYKELVKRFHPDTNGGDRGAEERLKQVIKAYGVLRASGLT